MLELPYALLGEGKGSSMKINVQGLAGGGGGAFLFAKGK